VLKHIPVAEDFAASSSSRSEAVCRLRGWQHRRARDLSSSERGSRMRKTASRGKLIARANAPPTAPHTNPHNGLSSWGWRRRRSAADCTTPSPPASGGGGGGVIARPAKHMFNNSLTRTEFGRAGKFRHHPRPPGAPFAESTLVCFRFGKAAEWTRRS
jgi:hypothetical protein